MDSQALEEKLRAVGNLADEDVKPAEVALWLAALDKPDQDIAPYQAHLDEMAQRAAGLSQQVENVQELAEFLTTLMSEGYQYTGDRETYDDFSNANVMDVIDRRLGLPVTLGILYLHAAGAAGAQAHGLSFPGHFILRLELQGKMAVIIDPFNGGQILNAADLRKILQDAEGPSARLTPAVYEPVSGRDVVLRLLNNLLTRSLAKGDTDHAIKMLTRMTWIAPKRAELWYELARMHIHQSSLHEAGMAFKSCLQLARAEKNWQLATLAAQALEQLRRRLN